MLSFTNAAYVGFVDNGQFTLTVKGEQGPDELLCFVVEGGYIQAWSVASFANFWLCVITIMNILKKLHIAPDKLQYNGGHISLCIAETSSNYFLQEVVDFGNLFPDSKEIHC